ncbi:hypothetical protein P872_03265 [Rhodonellum psychrophilum GCM71 = DSM 17998]|uniref:Tll0287-like domain-containing protein n=2 Tax=Rhodonellum TaxID=336827 RepID=U5C3D1_9BACT|nr:MULTISPECIES: DUF3365 domain-containing protein [Rhodonellum]ERM83411.1 hypothetical protein P872_03265 [Rhodonellum psychrophilum GCM71 = DSM 17998]MDO9552584.1 DUF3365 domain-containing protein [Rhodonellum sp.]SDY45319.1 Protein of unknown function [Rhodonellum ikkaensis]
MKKTIFSLALYLALSACGSNERVSKEVFEQVNRSMEVKKLSESEIIQAAMVWGEEISKESQEQLMAALKKAIADEGVPGAIEFCNVNALPIVREVGEKHGVTVRRVSMKYRNPEDKPLPEEEALLDAYTYNSENGIKNEPNIQRIQNGDILLFTKAIVIPDAFCLNCHGSIDKEISPETAQKLKNLYPEDKATGHKVGDLRGMWSIGLPKKELIKRL